MDDLAFATRHAGNTDRELPAHEGLAPSRAPAAAALQARIEAACEQACNAIAPSQTLSERIHPRWERMSPEEQAAALAKTPLRRVAQPEDQARVICLLASTDADFVTGITIDVTGGI